MKNKNILVLLTVLFLTFAFTTNVRAACDFYSNLTTSLKDVSGSFTCTVSGTEGIDDPTDNEESTTNSSSLTLSGGAVLIANGGTLATNRVSLSGNATLTIQEGGQIKPNAPVYVTDADGDAYPASWVFYTATAAGRRRLGLMRAFSPSNVDCNDSQFSQTNTCGAAATGTGNDGAVTIAANTNINTATIAAGRNCADGGDAVNYSVNGIGASSVTLTSTPSAGCLNSGDEVLLINLQGSASNYVNVGNFETFILSGNVTTTTANFTTSPTKYYGSGASDNLNIGVASGNQKVMLQRVPNYTNVTINNGVNLTASAFDGNKGGVLMFKATGTVANNGTIHTNSLGYSTTGYVANAGGEGGKSFCSSAGAGGGDGGIGPSAGAGVAGVCGGGGSQNAAGSALGGAGGGGITRTNTTTLAGAGGGGGYGTGGQGGSDGGDGYFSSSGDGATTGAGGGGIWGEQFRAGNKLYLGSSGGTGGAGKNGSGAVRPGGTGGTGGGALYIGASTITNSGGIQSNGNVGGNPTGTGTGGSGGGGGGGSGGSIYLSAGTLTLGTNTVTVAGGNGGTAQNSGHNGGAGGLGRIFMKYNSVSGTTTPSYTYGCFTSPMTSYQDSDGDTYGNPNVTSNLCPFPTGYVSDNTDCYDSNANARPNQDACYTAHRGDDSYDYNCSSANDLCGSTYGYTNTTSSSASKGCGTGVGGLPKCNSGTTNYYITQTAACGQTGYACTNSSNLCTGCYADDVGCSTSSCTSRCISISALGTQGCN